MTRRYKISSRSPRLCLENCVYRDALAGLKDLNNVWNNVKEIDLRPLAEAAQKPLRIALVGRQASACAALAEHMRRDPARPDRVTQTPLLIANLDQATRDPRAEPNEVSRADLLILIVDCAGQDDITEQALARSWANAGVDVLVILHQAASGDSPVAPPAALDHWAPWGKRQVISGDLEDPAFLSREFVPEVLRLFADRQLALARQFPLFRTAVAKALISDTCFSNAAYALSTGIAEIVPIFDIPLNIADMFVLSKAQAFLAYKLGLALGLSTRWQDYVAEFGGVLGGGFLWRQVARSLVGLIPVWGIIPKVAVSYAGTYVVGNAVYQWYLTGRHVSAQQMRQLYVQAFAHGKHVAQNMAARLPKPKRKVKEKAALPPPAQPAGILNQVDGRVCAACGRTSSPDAQFCQYCGQAF